MPKVSVIGDSLTVGSEPYLPSTWYVNGRVGRPSRTGLDLVPMDTKILVFALGTNDTPLGLKRSLDELVRRYGHMKLVIPTIHVPSWHPYKSDDYNGYIRTRADYTVKWRQAVQAHPEWLAGDKLHCTPRGYERRAQMIEDTVRSI